jgi:hypothetical protein
MWVVLLAATSMVLTAPASAQVLPWEIAVAEIEAGRIRNLAERLSKQNVLYQMHLGSVRRDDIVATAEEIDRVVETLRKGSPSYSIPEPWTQALAEQIQAVEQAWDVLRKIAVADPYRFVARDFAPQVNRTTDPLLIRHFDSLAGDLIAESETLIGLYDEECRKMAGIQVKQNRKGLGRTLEAYREIRRANDENPFFIAALDPARGASASAAGELLVSLRTDWDALAAEFRILAAGDETNFDLRRMLEIQSRLVGKVERLTAALVRYASSTYGS